MSASCEIQWLDHNGRMGRQDIVDTASRKNVADKRLAKREGGFITLMALIILTFILSVANAYFVAGTKEINIATLLLSGDQARQAATAGVRLTAGILVQDAIVAPATDHHGENWYLVTENTAGTKVPYALDTARGVYFHILVVDLSGRAKPNATDDATTTLLVDKLASWSTASATAAAANNYWTVAEYGQLAGIANDRVTGVSPYGTDFRININTADVKDDVNFGDPPDITQTLLKAIGGTASSNANTYSRRLVRQRRGGLAESCNAAYNPPLTDNNPAYVATTIGAWSTMAASWVSDACGSNPSTATEALVRDAAVTYGRINSEGFFLIKSIGWVVKDPSAGSCPDPSLGCREAQYTVMRTVRRTTAGYQDCANREWYNERRDLPAPPYAAGNYDYEMTYFIIDSNF